MAPRRKDNESDKRTLTQDMPILLCFLVPLVMVGVYHPHGGGWRPTEAKATGDLRKAGLQAEELGRQAVQAFNDADEALTKIFHDIEDARNAQSTHRTVYTAGMDQHFGDGVEERLRALRQMKGVDKNGREIAIPQRIVRDRDTSRYADTPDAPEPRDDAVEDMPLTCAPYSRGYTIAPGVPHNDDDFCVKMRGPARSQPQPQPQSQSRAQPTSIEASVVASTSPPIYLTPPQITEPVKRRLTAYAAGVNMPGKAMDWLKGLGLVGAMWLAMKWAQRSVRNASYFIVGGPVATMALWVFGW